MNDILKREVISKLYDIYLFGRNELTGLFNPDIEFFEKLYDQVDSSARMEERETTVKGCITSIEFHDTKPEIIKSIKERFKV